MSFVTLGMVSNGWGDLLKTSSLDEQCRRAAGMGFGYVELRQRALGEYEETVPGDDRPWPKPEALAHLRERAPGLDYNLAVEAPFLTSRISPQDSYLLRCAEAAVALDPERPIVRLVDLSPAHSPLEHEEAIDELGCSVADLARALWERGVRLALENSKQPLISLRAVIRRAAFGLPESVPIPELCWDPHNQISQTFLEEDPVTTARTIPIEEFFEFHFKQAKEGALQGDVSDGEIDWRGILRAMKERGYQGPALFELPPGPDIWERVERSTAYIRALLAEVEAA